VPVLVRAPSARAVLISLRIQNHLQQPGPAGELTDLGNNGVLVVLDRPRPFDLRPEDLVLLWLVIPRSSRSSHISSSN
jgi:hypothetical protein